MVSLKKICKIIVLFSVIILIGFQRMFGFLHFTDRGSLYRGAVALLAVVSAVVVLLQTRNRPKVKAYFKTATKYLIVYVLILALSITYTVITYGYSVKETINALIPYLYIFFCYPIIYIFYKDGGTETFSRTLSRIVLLILLIKTICWILYTFTGTELFPDLLFEYGTWSRDGQLRMDAGYLYGFAFAFYLSLSFKTRKFSYSKIAVLFLLLFMVFITKFRFQLISMVLTILVTYIFSAKTSKKAKNRVIILTIAIVIFIASGALEKVIGSFLVTSEYGGSTSARIETISHYWGLMTNQKAIIGLGLMDISNANAYSLMYRMMPWGTASLYYLEDIGIIGAFFKFGMLLIPLYGLLFYEGIRTCVKAVRAGAKDYIFLIAIVSYIIISCAALDIFDLQRALNVPFYLALISFVSCEVCKGKSDGQEMLEE